MRSGDFLTSVARKSARRCDCGGIWLQDTKPKGDSGASRFARFFAMEQSPGASAENPPAQHAPHASTAIAQVRYAT